MVIAIVAINKWGDAKDLKHKVIKHRHRLWKI
jgi:hypothetical protein